MRVIRMMLVLACLAGCDKSGPKPPDADIAAYLAQTQPAYLRVEQVGITSARPAQGGPAGSWRLDVHFVLHANEELYAATPDARALRTNFDRAVRAAEAYRVERIAAVESLAKRVGLMPDGAAAPEPALEVALVTRRDEEKSDTVTLLAQPDGHGWRFFQLTAQTLSDDQVGAPMAELKRASPTTQFVTANTEEARTTNARAQRFLNVISGTAKR